MATVVHKAVTFWAPYVEAITNVEIDLGVCSDGFQRFISLLTKWEIYRADWLDHLSSYYFKGFGSNTSTLTYIDPHPFLILAGNRARHESDLPFVRMKFLDPVMTKLGKMHIIRTLLAPPHHAYDISATLLVRGML